MRVPNQVVISVLWMVLGGASALAQSNSDTCHVYIVDVKAARQFNEKADLNALMNKSKQEQEKIAEAAGLGRTFDEFRPKVGEEELTTKTYPFLKSKLIVTASVFYTDESMASTGHPNSMLIGISVSAKALDSALDAPDAAIAEVSYDENTDVVRVKKNAVVDGRLYLVGLECRCKQDGFKEKK